MLNKSLRTRFILTFLATMLIAGSLTVVLSILVITGGLGGILHDGQLQLAEWMMSSGVDYSQDEQLEIASAGLYSVVRLEPDNPRVLEFADRLDNGEIVFDSWMRTRVADTLLKVGEHYYCISIFPNSAILIAVILALSISISGIIASGTIIASFTGKKFLRPIREMGRATRLIAQGDFSVRVSPPKNREMRELVNNFNSMTASLGTIETLQKDFINNVSHEFKTPLATISGFVTLLADDSLSHEDRQEYAQIVIDETKRLSKLSSNILSLSRLENSECADEKVSYSLDEQLRRIVLSLERRLQEKQLELDISLENTQINGPRELYAQVWLNLLDNAIKFTPDGGTITVRLERSDICAAVTVGDTGCGIGEQELSHIFDRFWQADKARSSDGNGLGLALTRRIIDVSGGSIDVVSTPGKGTVFTVKLPL